MTFSPSYELACQQFCETANHAGWSLGSFRWRESQSAKESKVDFAVSPEGEPRHQGPTPWLLVTSGLHGIEGFFGSAVQRAFMEQCARSAASNGVRCMLLHGLNPFGFENLRRTDQFNRDLNRNFLLPGESFSGSPALYASLNGVLNPIGEPRRRQLWLLKAVPLLARYGFRAIQAAIAGGQYDYPRGLFYGGSEASGLQTQLLQHLRQWFASGSVVFHLDLHTGLGKVADGKLLLDDQPSAEQMQILHSVLPTGIVLPAVTDTNFYQVRGSFGRWLKHQLSHCDYLYSCAEFGTYSPLRVLASLRRENQTHHWCESDSHLAKTSKADLLEVFCPSDPGWRKSTVDKAVKLCNAASNALRSIPEATLMAVASQAKQARRADTTRAGPGEGPVGP